MKASELIEKLKEQIKEHGDLEVFLEVREDEWWEIMGKSNSLYVTDKLPYGSFPHDEQLFGIVISEFINKKANE